jgi:hypothetical protein
VPILEKEAKRLSKKSRSNNQGFSCLPPAAFESWEQVTDAEVTTEDYFKTLTNPNSEGDRSFYRITGEIEPEFWIYPG